MTRATECRPVDAALTEPVCSFLCCETPGEWLAEALNHPEELLIDHANCEKKAAATAMKLMYRYTDNATLLSKMSQLAREELLPVEGGEEIAARRRAKRADPRCEHLRLRRG